MKNIIKIIAIALTLTSVSCKKLICLDGSNDFVKENREVTGFTKIDKSGFFDIKISASDSFEVYVYGDDNIVSKIRTEVSGYTLNIWTNETRCLNANKLEVVVKMPKLEGYSMSGSGNATIENAINSTSLNIDKSGSGNMNLEGTSQDLDIDISGSGNIDAYDFDTDKLQISKSGSGNVEITVSNSINGSMSGSGNLHYHGSPSVSVSKSGSGNLEKK